MTQSDESGNDLDVGEVGQTHIPNKTGFLNPSSETWHYLERCSGDYAVKKPIEDAVNDGNTLCGVCCRRFYWYNKGGST